MTDIEQAIIDAAVEWWVSICPIGVETEIHLRYPTVNTETAEEIKLAQAVAELVGEWKGAEQ